MDKIKFFEEMLGVIRALCLNYIKYKEKSMRQESESLRRELDAAFERDIESVLSRHLKPDTPSELKLAGRDI